MIFGLRGVKLWLLSGSEIRKHFSLCSFRVFIKHFRGTELILGASTKDMRTQLNLYGVFNGGQCLRCRNLVEEKPPMML